MSAVCRVLSQGARLTAAVGGSGDALVMCPAEGDSLGATKYLSAGPVSLPASIKTGDILLLMASDSRLTFIGSFEGKVSLSCGRSLLNRFYEKGRRQGGRYILSVLRLRI